MTTSSINTAEAKEQFADLINRVVHSNEHIILTRRGKEIAAIVPIDDLRLILQAQDRQDLREAVDSLKDARHAGSLTLEQLKEQLGV